MHVITCQRPVSLAQIVCLGGLTEGRNQSLQENQPVQPGTHKPSHRTTENAVHNSS